MPKRLAAIRRIYTGGALLLVNTLIVLVALNLVLYVAILGVRAFVRQQNPVAVKYGDGPLARAYPDLPQESVNGLLNETWSRRQAFSPYSMFKEAPHSGRFVNVHEVGFRMAPDQGPWPAPRDRYVVFLFGGSTAFSYGLPDHQALGSALQSAFRSRFGDNVLVYNFATGAHQSTQERVAFQELLAQGHVPDMAVFVDGLNDFAFPHVPRYTEQLRVVLNGSRVELVKWMGWRALESLPIATVASSVIRWSRPDETAMSVTAPDSASRELVESVLKRYRSNKTQVSAVARAFGVQPVFAWQPIPFYGYDPQYHPFSSEEGVNRYARMGYETAALRLKIDDDPAFLWLADMQSDLRESLYVDNVHYTASMTARIADEIAGQVQARDLGPRPK